MTLTVYTARVSYGGPERLDITRKSGEGDGLAFAPSWEILRGALDDMRRAESLIASAGHDVERREGQNLRRRAWGAYSVAFRAEMRASLKRDRGAWERLLARERVVLVCYCTNADYCHRTILATELLPALGAKYGGEVERLSPRMRVAITANRDLAPGDVARFEGPMAHLCGLAPEEIIVGGARGGDTLALDLAGRLRDKDKTRLVVIVPDTVDAQRPRRSRGRS